MSQSSAITRTTRRTRRSIRFIFEHRRPVDDGVQGQWADWRKIAITLRDPRRPAKFSMCEWPGYNSYELAELQSWNIARCNLAIYLSRRRLPALSATTGSGTRILDRFDCNPGCRNRRQRGNVNRRGSSAAAQHSLPRC